MANLYDMLVQYILYIMNAFWPWRHEANYNNDIRRTFGHGATKKTVIVSRNSIIIMNFWPDRTSGHGAPIETAKVAYK